MVRKSPNRGSLQEGFEAFGHSKMLLALTTLASTMNHVELQAEVQTLSMKLRIQGIALRELLRSLPKRRAAEYANRLRASLETRLLDVETSSLNDEGDQAVSIELAELLAIVSGPDIRAEHGITSPEIEL
jgi:hypothetical protein